MRLLSSGLALLLAVSPVTHPLGNFSVNQYVGLVFRPGGVSVTSVVNTAEIPTTQDKSLVDRDGDGESTAAERAAYASAACADVAAGLEVTVGGVRLAWQFEPTGYEYLPGAGGLPTGRLDCALKSTFAFGQETSVRVANHYRNDRVGWHELTATGDGVRLIDSPVPERSITRELREYPNVAAPADVVDVRTAVLRVGPAMAGAQGGQAGQPEAPAALPGARPMASVTTWMDTHFQGLASGPVTPMLVILAVLLAVLLGAGHALLPGHGKTVLAAYLAGRRGRPRDAVLVGGVVTVTHTAGVLVVGLLLTTTTALAGDRVLGYLGLISGLLVVGVGIGMVVRLIRRHERADHRHDHGDRRESHGQHGQHDPSTGRLGLAGMGVAGGLVPSPSALIVLLAAIGLGRAIFGVMLVIAYGCGMAATLSGAGLLMLAAQRRFVRAQGRLARAAALLPRATPVITAGLVVIVGSGLALRSATGLL
jgi:nickel/cobalt transporter (NicO) family protein